MSSDKPALMIDLSVPSVVLKITPTDAGQEEDLPGSGQAFQRQYFLAGFSFAVTY
jgi:hypothetical protein